MPEKDRHGGYHIDCPACNGGMEYPYHNCKRCNGAKKIYIKPTKKEAVDKECFNPFNDEKSIVEVAFTEPKSKSNNPKMVIVVRRDLHMRAGKLASQCAHAAMKFLTNHFHYVGSKFLPINLLICAFKLTKAEWQWFKGLFTKIVVGVDSEKELLRLVDEAKSRGIAANMIVDAGLTEFHGVPTLTCAAFGPEYSEKIDLLTGHLKLL